jgi:murein DD-endopeptidase MepM/ murein hydrolase activator NlpD
MVQIEHGTATASLISSYCHMSRFAAGIHTGEHVETRQLLGYVGQTGRATGPHLHFAIKKNGIFIDPLAMKLDGVRVVPPSKRDEFDAIRAELDKALDAIPLEPVSPDAGLPPAPADAGVPDATPEEIFDDTPMQ